MLTAGGQVAERPSAVLQDVKLVERFLGVPEDPGNPAGHQAILRAREQGIAPLGIELALRRARLGARLVPAGLGGSLTGVDALARIVRPVFRRDVGAGMSLAAVPFAGALPVWTAGSTEQRSRLADLLLRGRGISARHHARSIRYAFSPRGLRVRRSGGGFVLDGEYTGHTGSDALLLHATVESFLGPAGGPTTFFVDLPELPRDRVGVLPGDRIVFTRCPLPGGSVVGEAGGGAELFLRTLQMSGSATASMSLGAADTCLRIAMERTSRDPRRTSRSLSARTVGDIVSGAFLDLLACDCLALAGTRAAQLLPGETSVLSGAVRSVVPMLLGDSVQDLAALLGPQSLRFDGSDPLFAQHTRQLADLATGAFMARATVLPQLPFLARNAWLDGRRAPGALFDPAGDLPAFAPDLVTLLSSSDGVSGLLSDEDFPDRIGSDHADLVRLVTVLRAELDGVRRHFAAIQHGDRSLVTDPRSLAMADRYMLVLTAAACLGCYEQLRPRGHGFLSEPAWITGVLTRIVHRLGDRSGALSAEFARRVQEEATSRLATRRGFDLYETPLEGQW